MNRIFACLTLLLVSACAGQQTGGNLFTAPDIITLADAQQALAISEAGGDKLGSACFQYWVLHADDPHVIPSPSGPLSAYAEARALRRKVEDGIPEDLMLACGPVIMDSRNTVRRLLLRFGGL